MSRSELEVTLWVFYLNRTPSRPPSPPPSSPTPDCPPDPDAGGWCTSSHSPATCRELSSCGKFFQRLLLQCQPAGREGDEALAP